MAVPEEPWYRPASKRISQNRGFAACRRQSPDGLRGGRSAVTAAGDGDPASNSVQLVATPVTVPGSPDRRRPSGKAARCVERLALLQDVIAGARQLVRQRLGGDHGGGL